MLKKITAVFLILVLMASTAVTALAAGDALNEKLARVTQLVKQTLEIDDRYTQYDGRLTEEGDYSYWELTWSSDTESLSVCADENGKVLRYDRYSDNGYVYDYYYGYAPALPETSAEDALPVAQAFVDKVLGPGESVSYDPYDAGRYTSDVDSYTFSGTVELNGLKSPIYFYVEVQTGDMRVNRFYRSDCYNNYGAVPSAKASVSSDKAAALLAGTLEMRLLYVLDDDGETAVLQYLPVYSGDWIVDAKTGQLIDLDALYDDMVYGKSLAGNGAAQETADEGAFTGGTGLSEVEQSAVDALEGVLSKEELDAAVRGMTELGVGRDWTLQSIGYTTDKEAGRVFGQLYYTSEITDEAVIKDRFPDAYDDMKSAGHIYPIYCYKSVSVDAMTGGLISIYSYTNSGYEQQSKLDASRLGEKAAAFLQKYFPDTYAQTALNEPYGESAEGAFVYSQLVSGILFPQNSALVDVNVYDGTIDSFNISWTDDVHFDSADGLVSADAALETYTGCFDTLLQYLLVPVQADAYGYSYTYALKLAYKLESEESVTGVDAKPESRSSMRIRAQPNRLCTTTSRAATGSRRSRRSHGTASALPARASCRRQS
jgi:hypothetical protein